MHRASDANAVDGKITKRGRAQLEQRLCLTQIGLVEKIQYPSLTAIRGATVSRRSNSCMSLLDPHGQGSLQPVLLDGVVTTDPSAYIHSPSSIRKRESSREAGCAVVFETVVVTTEDGSAFKTFVAYARGESKGGVVILHEIFGVTGQSQSVTRSYVDDGFDAIVPALFNRASCQTVVEFDDLEKRSRPDDTTRSRRSGNRYCRLSLPSRIMALN